MAKDSGDMHAGEDGSRAGEAPARKKKPKKRKEKASLGGADDSARQAASSSGGGNTGASAAASASSGPPPKKQRKQGRRNNNSSSSNSNNNNNSGSGSAAASAAASKPVADAAQQAVYDQMRRALNEDQYSAVGSVVEGTDSEEEDLFLYRGQAVRLDRAALQQTAKKMAQAYWYPQNPNSRSGMARHLIHPDFSMSSAISGGDDDDAGDDVDDMEDDGTSSAKESSRVGGKKKRKKEVAALMNHQHPGAPTDVAMSGGVGGSGSANGGGTASKDSTADFLDPEEDLDRDGGSIFGQTTGATNSTWVECDKCKKWRRLRGVVDEKKLPPKWYCSMNRNDPERARCSAPEEDYDTQQTPESAADARTRKHLRVWVRRLQCQEAYEARQPTLTRGKKRAAASSMKDPYEWVRCCNPSCGKWRVVLRFMDAKSTISNSSCPTAADGGKEWYCVMNTWDEKMASCAAPQENLPAVGCPPWVLQDEE